LNQEVYQKLAHHLDSLPSGYPSTESGVELRILERLFTPEEAELATHLTLLPEEARVVARRAAIDPAQAEQQLEKMARKGLIMDEILEGQPPRYQAAQFVIGIWEFQVDNLDPELIKDVDEYRAALLDEGWAKMPQIRTIPVEASMDASARVLPHERALKLLDSHDKFLVIPCICRQERTLVGEGCNKPEHYCLVLGSAADYYHRNNLGKLVDKAEMAEMIRQADKHGLVLQPTNAKEAVNICCCCGCCCGVLTSFKKYPRPGEMVYSAFVTTYDQEACTGCGACEDRCPMDALSMDEEKALFKPERCIGCGLCTTTCPGEALALTRRPESEKPKVPATFEKALLQLAQKRGRLGPGELASMLVKSKLDRLLAPRSKS